MIVRRKVYTKEHILKAAYELISKEGFNNFTARNIAKKMEISTQPIYLEFKNMQDLKNTLIETVFRNLLENTFTKTITGDRMLDLGLNYIEFAQKNRNLYVALFVEENGGGKLVYDISYDHFKRSLENDEHYEGLTEETLKQLHDGLWIIVTGIASLKSAGIMDPDQATVIEIVERAVNNIINKEVKK